MERRMDWILTHFESSNVNRIIIVLHCIEEFVSTQTVSVRTVYGNRVLHLCDYSVGDIVNKVL